VRLAQEMWRTRWRLFKQQDRCQDLRWSNRIAFLPEIVDVGEYREEANYQSRLHTQNHWLVFYVVEGASQIGLEGEPEIWLKPGSVACLPPNLSYWRRHGPESKHLLLRVGFQLSAIDDRHP
jgi:hypothetical protein